MKIVYDNLSIRSQYTIWCIFNQIFWSSGVSLIIVQQKLKVRYSSYKKEWYKNSLVQILLHQSGAESPKM